MNNTQLRDYLFSDHYKAWPVLEAIKPHTDYQHYVKDAATVAADTLVCAFGATSGQTLPIEHVRFIKLDDNSYYVKKTDIFRINVSGINSEHESGEPSDYMLCAYPNSHEVFHPDDMVFTTDHNWLPKSRCRILEPAYYGGLPHEKPVYIHKDSTRDTHDGEVILRDDAIYCESDGEWYHEDTEELYYSDTCNYYLHIDDDCVQHCDDIGEYVMEHHAHWDEIAEVYVYDRDNLTSRDHTQSIQDYHCGIDPEFKTLDLNQNVILSKYTIGFEVEKDCLRDGNQDCGSLIEQQPLFSHWETDSSCGIEGITNVYSLDNSSQFINDVRNSDYTNLDTNSRCGGHINFAHRENKLQYWHIRPWLGLIFSMWKKRLNNQYSSCNKKLNPYRGTDYHYGALVEKGRNRSNVRFELRLPNKVKDGDTLIRRFCLIQHLIECVDLYINEDFSWMSAKYDDDNIIGIPNWITDDRYPSHDNTIANLITTISPQTRQRTRFFFDKAKSIIMQGYAPEEYKRVLIYAYAFQSYIDEETPSGVVTELTNPYINS